MKRFILTGFLAIGSLLAVQAQNVKFGVKGGLNLSKLTNVDDAKVLTGFNAGGLMNYKFNDSWAVQPEIQYSTQGSKANTILGKGTFKLDYINIPVLAQYHIESFFLEAGPQVGFMTSAKLKAGPINQDVKDQMKTVDFGLNFGLGYKLDMGLGIGARYNFGLTNIYDNGNNGKNSVAQIDLFYIF
ncbi:PorT family protein [Chitinophaga silvatica]|uniref:PorT family protein n=1 Tax=Chitinophaga silvatica TaxID=2282649 RepID=A0A3E1YEV2_9BACT|nr:porin family protein [Chitinophaga silvatica]RFS25009.1 PorT family protein [Chitinophaga silvatica]